MKSKIYLETTIISYLCSKPSRDLVTAAHQQITFDWWEHNRHNYDLYISQIVIKEASMGDQNAAEKRLAFLANMDLLELTDASLDLAAKLIDTKILPVRAADDALHISTATMNGMDYLLTWNCTHLANANIRKNVEKYCQYLGYECPVICTPEELMEG